MLSLGVNDAGFGLPSQRKRVFVVASLYGDARDVLLSQVRAWAHLCRMQRLKASLALAMLLLSA